MTKFEKTTHIVLLSVVVLSSVFIARSRHGKAVAFHQGAVSKPQGDQLLTLPVLDWSKARVNILLLLNDQCSFCKKSMPFYRALDKRRKSKEPLKIYVASQEPEERISAYLKDNGVESDGIVYTPHGLGGSVVDTPTLLVVNDHGVLLERYVGLLNPFQEARLVREGEEKR